MSCSRILNLMVLIGFMVNYMLRVNFTIAIVDMVPKQENATVNASNNSFGPIFNSSLVSILINQNNSSVNTSDDLMLQTNSSTSPLNTFTYVSITYKGNRLSNIISIVHQNNYIPTL